VGAIALGLSTVSHAQDGILADPGISAASFEQELGHYLNGNEIKSVLTPGEFSQFPLKLKAGQVVIGEARSDDFDPALEIVDANNKTLAFNDDRYPGDQRPLLFWRCEEDGDYQLHVRCFHDKTGGQFFVRFNIYNSVDLSSGQKVEAEIDAHEPILLRVPMKAGQIKEVLNESGGDHKYLALNFNRVIAPGGCPDLNLSQSIRPISGNYVLMAAADGDYYYVETPDGSNDPRGKIHVWARELIPGTFVKDGDSFVSTAPTKIPAVWELPVRAGAFIRASMLDLDIDCVFVASEVPNISKVDLSKPETNPFIPRPDHQTSDLGPVFDQLPARAGDSRGMVLRINRDAKIWFASNGAGHDDKRFTLRVSPAASSFPEDTASKGILRVANTDYWDFDAQAGDVLSLNSSTVGFTGTVIVRDPEMAEVRHADAPLDQNSESWRMIVQKPGRYVVAISCVGDGGSGDYSLSRKVLHAQPISHGSPAKGDVGEGQIQVWKFTATPDKPLFIHWNSSNWSYDVDVYDDKGNPASFQRDSVDEHNRFGILRVTKPQTYVIVLTGHGDKASYTIDLGDIPGYKNTLH
jgi:hypothetical protein